MDGTRFDRLTRMFALVGTRRQVVAGAAVVAVGAGGLATADAATRCRAGRQTCQRNNQCCSGACRRGREVPLKDRNRCACGEGETRCGNICADLQYDEHNCGDCGTRCRTGDVCCPSGCVDTATDVANCGACGNFCGDGAICCDGSCVAADSDPTNCGACGHVCPDGGGCYMGACDYPERCGVAWMSDTVYCLATSDGATHISAEDPPNVVRVVDTWDHSGRCSTSGDCESFAVCNVTGVSCACATAQWYGSDFMIRVDPPTCYAVIDAQACSDPLATPDFARCNQTVEGDIWGSTSSHIDTSNWACTSSDQCNVNWDPLCADPEHRCGCVFSSADTPGAAGILSLRPVCFRDRVTPV